MIATNTVLRARRAVAMARAALSRSPQDTLDRAHAEQLIAAIEQLAGQIDELNRILFALESELHYADEADAAEREACPDWLRDAQQARPRPPIPGLPKED